MRFVHQQPQYDEYLQMSNFFPNQWTAGSAQVMYVAGCKSGHCSVLGRQSQRYGSA